MFSPDLKFAIAAEAERHLRQLQNFEVDLLLVDRCMNAETDSLWTNHFRVFKIADDLYVYGSIPTSWAYIKDNERVNQ